MFNDLSSTELILDDSAQWANPIGWEVFPCGSWLYSVFGISCCWVVFVPADVTYVFFHVV